MNPENRNCKVLKKNDKIVTIFFLFWISHFWCEPNLKNRKEIINNIITTIIIIISIHAFTPGVRWSLLGVEWSKSPQISIIFFSIFTDLSSTVICTVWSLLQISNSSNLISSVPWHTFKCTDYNGHIYYDDYYYAWLELLWWQLQEETILEMEDYCVEVTTNHI